MFGSLGFTELILILFIVLIIFGAGKLPQLGEGITGEHAVRRDRVDRDRPGGAIGLGGLQG